MFISFQRIFPVPLVVTRIFDDFTVFWALVECCFNVFFSFNSHCVFFSVLPVFDQVRCLVFLVRRSIFFNMARTRFFCINTKISFTMKNINVFTGAS